MKSAAYLSKSLYMRGLQCHKSLYLDRRLPAYSMGFEKRVLRELGDSIPKLRKRLNAVAEGMIDLMEPFKRRDICHWRMNGSYSLKSVLPVLSRERVKNTAVVADENTKCLLEVNRN